ncbi:MAG: substrate-binding domain-containing protein, partial [Nitrospirales bacterium]|nr:substrate-binding domain-containing protein [Nitrospirales bacterium]
NAQLGFVALSQVLDPKFQNTGSRWDVPPHLYDPLIQQAVLLTRGQSNPTAKKLLVYMKGKSVRDIIKGFGYGTDYHD